MQVGVRKRYSKHNYFTKDTARLKRHLNLASEDPAIEFIFKVAKYNSLHKMLDKAVE